MSFIEGDAYVGRHMWRPAFFAPQPIYGNYHQALVPGYPDSMFLSLQTRTTRPSLVSLPLCNMDGSSSRVLLLGSESSKMFTLTTRDAYGHVETERLTAMAHEVADCRSITGDDNAAEGNVYFAKGSDICCRNVFAGSTRVVSTCHATCITWDPCSPTEPSLLVTDSLEDRVYRVRLSDSDATGQSSVGSTGPKLTQGGLPQVSGETKRKPPEARRYIVAGSGKRGESDGDALEASFHSPSQLVACPLFSSPSRRSAFLVMDGDEAQNKHGVRLICTDGTARTVSTLWRRSPNLHNAQGNVDVGNRWRAIACGGTWDAPLVFLASAHSVWMLQPEPDVPLVPELEDRTEPSVFSWCRTLDSAIPRRWSMRLVCCTFSETRLLMDTPLCVTRQGHLLSSTGEDMREIVVDAQPTDRLERVTSELRLVMPRELCAMVSEYLFLIGTKFGDSIYNSPLERITWTSG